MSTIPRRVALAGGVAGLMAAASWSAPAAAQEEKREDAADTVETARPRLGILQRHAGMGVLVTQVLPGSPADRAGIFFGDLIVAVNGHPLVEPLEDEDQRAHPEEASYHQARLEWLMEEVPEGEPVELSIQRGRRIHTIAVAAEVLPDFDAAPLWTRDVWPDPTTYDSITERFRDAMDKVRYRVGPDEFEIGWMDPGFPAGRVPGDPDIPLPPVGVTPTVMLIDAGGWWRDRFHYVGDNRLEMVQLNPELGAYFGTDEGVLVLDVDANVTLGLRAGDVVVSIGGREVDEVSDLQRILASYEEDEAVDFGIWRDGARATVVGTIR
ncbi:MAG: PDZ domain-containing protein [Gemmatimonadetes bacterium]|nr:PDZ domain-containing protein [Gemmatimonadota bacterium]